MKGYSQGTSILILIATLVMAAAGAARGQEPGGIHPLDSDPREILPYETLEKYSLSAVEEDTNHIITTRSEWKKVWKLIHNDEASRPPLPYVDFSVNMVIAVFRGQTGPLEVNIRLVFLTGSEHDKLTVVVTDTVRNRACPDLPVVTRPYHIVTVKKVSKKIRKNASFEVEQVAPPDCQSR